MTKHVYTFANMNGKQCQVTTSTELSPELLAKYKEALGIACTHTEEPMGNDIAPPSREYDAAAAHIEALEAALNEMHKAEHQILDAYVRLRVILGALNTPLAPTPEQIYTLTESKANSLKAELDQMTARCAELERWADQVLNDEYATGDEKKKAVDVLRPDAVSLSAIKADTLEEVAKFVEMQEGQCFDPKVMAAAIRGNLKYGDHFSFFAAALREESKSER